MNQSIVARAKLEAWRSEVAQASEHEASRILQQIARNHPDRLISSWDQMASILLELAAFHRGSTTLPDPLKLAMNRVRFPDSIDSPRDFRVAHGEQSLTANEWIELLKPLAELIPEH